MDRQLRILVLGATGQVGGAVVNQLKTIPSIERPIRNAHIPNVGRAATPGSLGRSVYVGHHSHAVDRNLFSGSRPGGLVSPRLSLAAFCGSSDRISPGPSAAAPISDPAVNLTHLIQLLNQPELL